MHPVMWGGIVVILLVIIAVVTMAKTKWRRTELDQPRDGQPRNKGRVSGGDDD
jgi:hypothetical protein